MDITTDFAKLLQAHGARVSQKTYNVDTVEKFLKEAHRINSRISSLHRELKDVRSAYLSGTRQRRSSKRSNSNQQRVLSDREREEIDANSKSMLRELNSSIGMVEEAEKLRRQTEKELIAKKFSSGLGALGSWASGGAIANKTPEQVEAESKAEQAEVHRDGVLWFLRKRLEGCLRVQQDMMEARLSAELSHSLPVQAGPSLSDFADYTPTRAEPNEQKEDHDISSDQGLSAEQIQMFEEGNQDMMTHFDTALDKVRAVESSLREISELHGLLTSNLATQAAHIEQLVQDSDLTTENVGGGNKELKKATQRPSAARYTFFGAAGLCTFMIIWDLLI